jgi:Putative ATPase subunit of terminase (gpP-like).
MGYRGKVEERQRARELRAQSWTLQEIATELGVARSTVSVWVRDVDYDPRPRTGGHPPGPEHPMRLRRLAELDRCHQEGLAWVGALDARDLTMFSLGLYAGEGDKGGTVVGLANTNPRYLRLFVTWLRGEFDIDEHRLKARLYLHEGLDLSTATLFWSRVLDIPPERFRSPHRPADRAKLRRVKHPYGCATVTYTSSLTARRLLARVEAIASPFDLPG